MSVKNGINRNLNVYYIIISKPEKKIALSKILFLQNLVKVWAIQLKIGKLWIFLKLLISEIQLGITVTELF